MSAATLSPNLSPNVAPVGAYWPLAGRVWGCPAGRGEAAEVFSPADNALVQNVRLLDEAELACLVGPPPNVAAAAGDPAALWPFVARLGAALDDLSPLLHDAMRRETGFAASDCDEMTLGAREYVREFRRRWKEHAAQAAAAPPSLAWVAGGGERQIHLSRVPWGTVAVVLPQNAFLLLAVTCLLNALAAGNRVILRAPLGSARSAALLGLLLDRAGCPPGWVSVALVRARPFVCAVQATPAPCLIHYMGGSSHGADLLARSFDANKTVLLDGEGNVWVWVGPDAAPEASADLLTRAAALRYNGQTCTSVNGAIIHPAVYSRVRAALVARWKCLRAGDPLSDPHVHVGPLFDDAQAAWCEQQATQSGGTILCGGQRTGNRLTPVLIEEPREDSGLATNGVFGPALWIAPGERGDFVRRWAVNRFPLCAGVLSPGAQSDAAWWLSRLPNLARLVMNGDPSEECLWEPWGGYGASGANPVSAWADKYRRVVQVDAPL